MMDAAARASSDVVEEDSEKRPSANAGAKLHRSSGLDRQISDTQVFLTLSSEKVGAAADAYRYAASDDDDQLEAESALESVDLKAVDEVRLGIVKNRAATRAKDSVAEPPAPMTTAALHRSYSSSAGSSKS